MIRSFLQGVICGIDKSTGAIVTCEGSSKSITLKSKPSRRLLFLYLHWWNKNTIQVQAVVQAVSLSCQSTAAASNHQGLLPTLFYPIYRVSDHSTSISFIGLQFLFIFCLLYELLHLPFQVRNATSFLVFIFSATMDSCN